MCEDNEWDGKKKKMNKKKYEHHISVLVPHVLYMFFEVSLKK